MRIRLYKYIVSIVFLIPTLGMGQFTSTEGRFSIDQQRGCRDLTVTVTNIDSGTGVVLYQFEGALSPITNNPVFTYTTSGNYYLFQFIQGPTGQKKDSILVEILDPIQPLIELQSCNLLALQVQIPDTNYDVYEIDYGDGTILQQPVGTIPTVHSYVNSTPVTIKVTGLYTTANNRCSTISIPFTPVAAVLPAIADQFRVLDTSTGLINYTLAPNSICRLEISVNDTSGFQVFSLLPQISSTDTIKGLDMSNNQYCFRIATLDACSNTRSYSNILCSTYLSAMASNNQIDLTWPVILIDSNQSVDIQRDGSFLASRPGTQGFLSDTTVLCNTTYCYSIQINYPGAGMSISNMTCQLAFSTDKPDSVTDISSIHRGTQLQWDWNIPPGNPVNNYAVTLFDTRNRQLLMDTTTVNQYFSSVEPDSAQCLQIKVKDVCGNMSNGGIIACSILLSGEPTIDGAVALSWTVYQGWTLAPLNYALVTLDPSSQVIDSVLVGQTNSYTEPIDKALSQVSRYVVWAISSDPLVKDARSNEVEVIRNPIIAVPNAFTPNGDAKNDTFNVKGRFLERIDLTIFTRWGEAIFNSLDGTGWDGQINDQIAPIGNYVYRINVEDSAGFKHERTGTVLLLKNK